MTLKHYIEIIGKRWRLIITCIVVVTLSAYVVSKLMMPLYQSSVLIQITIHSGTNQADINSLLASDQLIQTEAELAVSNTVLRDVAAHHQGLSVDELARRVNATPKLDTQLFEISVVDPSPVNAATLANEVAAALIKHQQQVFQANSGPHQQTQNLQQNLTATQTQMNAITSQISKLRAGGGSEQQMTGLIAQLNGLQQHYDQLQSTLAQLQLAVSQNDNFLQIAQPAQIASRPVQPNTLLNTAAGLLTGLLLGILLSVLSEQLDTRIHAQEELAHLLERPVLATIWQSSPADIVHPQDDSANIEAFRILRTGIGFASVDKPVRTLAVTSAQPRDGKSVIAANLAIFMAKTGKRTLLVDADLRRPTLHLLFGLSLTGKDLKGLSDAIMAAGTGDASPTSNAQPRIFVNVVPGPVREETRPTDLSLNEFVYHANIPNLQIMPAGSLPPNPTELLESQAMQRFLAVLRHCQAEVIIFDTPPLLGLSDASLLASKVDGTLVVLDITRTTKKTLAQTNALLRRAGSNVLGYIVNKQRRSRKHSVYSYYYSADEVHKSYHRVAASTRVSDAANSDPSNTRKGE
ncbi:MAG TPA: Wzz/FepE/Etk N-terminal domain-containing protein [Ktedonosporobacter sp.]|jgi:non-specific protein-tyrosine kinase|nr:Wzz/FepE/Etk N-terminal domain-containing protein [Ktedonosporobacter sp.]